MMLICVSRQEQVVAAEVMVMPRSCSCAIQSMMAAPSWTSPILCVLPGVEQDALGGRGLAGVDVGHDADVARVLRRVLSHVTYLVPSMRKPLTDEGQ